MSDQPHYSIVIEWSDEDALYIVSLPEWGDLVHTHGRTYEEALQNGKELIEALVASRKQDGVLLPEPRIFVAA